MSNQLLSNDDIKIIHRSFTVFAFIFVAIVGVKQYTNYQSFENLEGDAYKVNVSGKQRMLSQRFSKELLLNDKTKAAATFELLKSEEERIQAWILKDGADFNTAHLQKEIGTQLASIESRLNCFFEGACNLDYTVFKTLNLLLQNLDTNVTILENKAEAKIEFYKNFALGIFAVMMLLAAVFWYVFGFWFLRRVQGSVKNHINNSKLASLGEMAGGVAHEINNPLAILANLQIKTKKIFDLERENIDPKHYEMLDKAFHQKQRTVKRIASIVKGLKTFARDGSNDDMQRLSICSVIEDTLSFCESNLESKQITLTVDTNCAIKIDCRATQLSQVLLNLINNAKDAIEGTEGAFIRVHSSFDTENLYLNVTDSGNGISKEIENKIFQPFFTTKGVEKGTGLGLSISKGIMKQHGGDLYVDHYAANTTFVMKLPLAAVDAVEDKEAA